ncbi:MAG: hypothetical protein ACE5G0_00605 [Rhodothermales bacterium]
MKTSLLKILSAVFVSILLFVGTTGCGGNHTSDEAIHEHGPDTHTHETPSAIADTAGTYADTTSIDHEHGPETHTHDDVPAHE